jgi:hypothetical protein
MDFPAKETSGFPGRRLEPYRAGMTTTICGEFIELPFYIVPEKLLL